MRRRTASIGLVLLLLLGVALGGTAEGKLRVFQPTAVIDPHDVDYRLSLLQEELAARPTELDTLGHPVHDRPRSDMATNIQFVETSLRFSQKGVITAWSVNVVEAGPVRLQVYRRVDEFKFTLVGENMVMAVKGLNVHEIPADQQINVLPGDVLGWRYDETAAKIVYDDSATGALGHVLFSNYPDTEPHLVGTTLTFPFFEQRSYSIQAQFRFNPNPSDQEAEVRTVGHAISERTFYISDGEEQARVSIVDLDLTFDHAGIIESWTVFGGREGGLRLQVWRQKDNTTFSLIGENAVRAKGQGYQTFVIGEHEAIVTQAGDVLGWTSDTDGVGVLSYDQPDEGPTVRMSGAPGPPSLRPGEDLDFPFRATRIYSIQASFRKLSGATVAGRSYAEGEGLSAETTAGAQRSFTIYAVDKYGNRIHKGGDAFRVELVGTGSLKDVTLKGTIHDNADGTYGVSYSPRRAGTYALSITLGGVEIASSPFPIMVRPGETSPKESRARGGLVSGATVGLRCPIIIEARDAGGNLVTHGGDIFQVRVHGPESSNVTVSDKNDGTYIAEYFPKKAGDYEVFLTLRGENIQGSPFHVAVTPGETSGMRSIAFGPGLQGMEAGVPTQFTVQTLDEFGNPETMGSDIVEVQITGPTAPDGEPPMEESGEGLVPAVEKNVPSEVVDMGDGTYKVTYGTTEGGLYTVRVTVGGVPVQDSPFRVPVEAGPSHPLHTFAKGDGLSLAYAGIPSHFTIYAFDEFGNKRTKGGDAITASLALSSRAKVTGIVSDNNDGTYLVSYTLILKGTFSLKVEINNGMPIRGSPYTVVCKVGPANATRSRLKDVDTCRSLEAGQPGKFTIQTRDMFGNTREEGGDKFNVTVTLLNEPEHPLDKPVEVDVHDNRDGTYGVSFVPIRAGRYTVSVDLEGRPIGKPFNVTVQSAPASPGNCEVWGPGLQGSVAGHPTQITILARDEFNNVQGGGNEDFKVQLMGPLERKSVAEAAEKVEEEEEEGGTPMLFLQMGEDVEGTETPSVDPEADEFYSKVKCAAPVEEKLEQGDGLYNLTYSTTVAGSYDMMVLLNGQEIKGSPFRPTILPDVTHPSETYAWGAGTVKAVAGEVATFWIHSVDQYGNKRSLGGDQFSIFLDGSQFVQATYLDHGNATYTANYVATKAGDYNLQVRLDNGTGPGIQGSPFKVHVSPGPISAAHSVPSGAGAHEGYAGQNQTFNIRAFDRFDNELGHGNDTFTIIITGPEDIKASYIDRHDGLYTVYYTPWAAGLHLVHVSVDTDKSNPLQGSPFNVTILPVECHCQPHGVCRADGSCLCDPGWFGERCDVENCGVNFDGVLKFSLNVPWEERLKVGTGEPFSLEVSVRLVHEISCDRYPHGMALVALCSPDGPNAVEQFRWFLSGCGEESGVQAVKGLHGNLAYGKKRFGKKYFQQAALTFDGDVLKFYHNTTLDGTTLMEFPSAIPAGSWLQFGKSCDSSVLFEGMLDEVRFWDDQITAEQQESYAGQSLKGDEPNLAAYWHFNDCGREGPILYDVVAHLPGIPTISEEPKPPKQLPPPPLPSVAPGEPTPSPVVVSYSYDPNPKALEISEVPTVPAIIPQLCCNYANGGYASVPNIATLNFEPGQPFTFEGWVYIRNGGVTVLDKSTDACKDDRMETNYRIIIGMPKMDLDTRVGIWNNEKDPLFGMTFLPVNDWHHIAVVYDGKKVTFFVNGVYDGSFDWQEGIPNPGQVYIGRDAGDLGSYYNGKMQEMRLWRSPRTRQQIRQLMFQKLDGSEVDLISYWAMDLGYGEEVMDLAPTRASASLHSIEWAEQCAPIH